MNAQMINVLVRRKHYFKPLPDAIRPADTPMTCTTCGCVFAQNLHMAPRAMWMACLRRVSKNGTTSFRPKEITDDLVWLCGSTGTNVIRGLAAAGMVRLVQAGTGQWVPALYEATDWGRGYLKQTSGESV